MKKIIFIIFMFLIIFIKVNASSYNCTISGDEYIYPYDSQKTKFFYTSNIKINIDGIKDIDTFDLDVSFDNDLIEAYECSLLNNNATKCKIEDNNIVYSYKKSKKNTFENDLYKISFISKEVNKELTSTDIEVKISNIKDKTNKKIDDITCKKTLKYKDYSDYVIPSENTETNISTDNIDGSNYIKSLNIEGYVINFNKKTQEYTINADSDVNRVDIDIELEDINAKYIINGASDLNSFGNKISIIVTSTKNEEREYKIIVNKEKKEIDSTSLSEDIKNVVENKSIKRYTKYAIIILILLVLLIIIIRKISSRKLDRYLNKM